MSSSTKKVRILSRAFGSGIPSRDGDDIAFKCPKCGKPGSSKKKLAINLEKGMYHCWVCGLSGKSVHSLFKKYAPSLLGELSQIKDWSSSYKSQKTKIVEEVTLEAPKGFLLLAAQTNTRDPDVKAAIRYCQRRGLTTKDMWYFKLGTCTSGRFRRRIVFPSFTSSGNLNYYTARAIDDSTLKYVNAPVAKKEVLFNDINIDWKKPLTLVEGPFDLTKCPYNSSCLLGSHLPEDSVLFKKIVKNSTPVVLALDPDAVSKAHDIAKSLSAYGISVKMTNIPNDKDVGDMNKEEVKRIISNSIIWKSDDRLINLISKIKTGSIV